jgi:hypothetical protein
MMSWPPFSRRTIRVVDYLLYQRSSVLDSAGLPYLGYARPMVEHGEDFVLSIFESPSLIFFLSVI